MTARLAGESPGRTRRLRRWRLGVLLGLFGLSLAAYVLSERYPPAPFSEVSASGRRIMADVRAMGGEAAVTERSAGFLGRFGRTEQFHVRLNGRPVDDEAFGRLLARHGDRIDGLDLRNTRITNDGLRHLARATGLRHLVLGNAAHRARSSTAPESPVTDAGLVHLRGLHRLMSLDLSGLPITDAGVASLQDLPALSALTLSRTKVQGPGLGRLKLLPDLAVLILDDTEVTDRGMGGLAGAANLQYLDLRGMRLTGAALVPLKGLARLRELRLGNNGLLDDEVANLRKFRPMLKVSR